MKPVESRQAQQMHVPIHPSKIEYNLSPTQDQASTALEGDPGPIQDQAKTALGSASTLSDFKTHLLHVTSTCIRRALKWGHL